MDIEQSLSLRAAWLAYVGGYTQEQIAERLGVSRIKVQRLIAAAMQSGQVKFWVEGVPADCMALEEELIASFGLKRCVVVPSVADGEASGGEIPSLAVAGARVLCRELEGKGPRTVGFGHGRTLAALVERLPKMALPDTRFVSLLGSFMRSSAANPFDVMTRLAERTAGQCFYLPVPFIVETRADAEMLRSQRDVQKVLLMMRACELCVIGIGEMSETPQLHRTQSITTAELKRLLKAGAVGEVAGRFIGADGALVDSEMNQRAMGVSLEDLRGRNVLAVAGGTYKAGAIRAVLRSGVLTSLVVDELTAELLLRPDGPPAR